MWIYHNTLTVSNSAKGDSIPEFSESFVLLRNTVQRKRSMWPLWHSIKQFLSISNVVNWYAKSIIGTFHYNGVLYSITSSFIHYLVYSVCHAPINTLWNLGEHRCYLITFHCSNPSFYDLFITERHTIAPKKCPWRKTKGIKLF